MINLEAVRASGSRPRVHGNGFIQLDLTERSRLHIWGDPRIPRQKVSTPIHDHVFGFTSRIIIGRLINVVYTIKSHMFGEYRIYVPEIQEGENTILKPTKTRVIAEPITVNMITWGYGSTGYGMKAGDLHETFAPDGPAATIMIKDDTLKIENVLPRVLVPVTKVPDNDFNRYDADEDMLWRIIKDTLKLRKYG